MSLGEIKGKMCRTGKVLDYWIHNYKKLNRIDLVVDFIRKFFLLRLKNFP